MKKLLLSIIAIAGFYSAAYPQCIPDITITDPGIYPDTVVNLPSGNTGVFYDTDIQVKVLTDTTISPGLVVTVLNITIDSVAGLPSGFSYSCNPTSCVFPGGSNGCIRLFGTNATPGSYDLTVYVTLNGTLFGFPVQQASTVTGYHIILNAPVTPVAAFTASATSLCEDLDVTFTDQSLNNPTSYLWTFPGGTPATSTDPNPVVTYAVGGSYNVSLAATNAAGTGTNTQTSYITVIAKPLATISPSGTLSICAGQGITLQANSGTNLTYQWFRFANLLTGETNQTLQASAAGAYKVKVTDTLTGCTKRSELRTVVTLPLPAITISAGGPVSFCKGGSVVLTASTSVNNTIEWVSGGAPISGATALSYEAFASEYFRAFATSPDGCSKFSNGIVVTAKKLPANGITASGPLTFCQGDSVTFNVQAVAGNTYQWEQNLTPISGQTATTYKTFNAGKYSYMVTGVNGCSRRSAIKKVVINCREALYGEALDFTTRVYPNPANESCQLELKIPVGGMATIELLDVTGRLVSQIVKSDFEQGIYNIDLNTASLPAGLYFIQTKFNGQVLTTKLIIK